MGDNGNGKWQLAFWVITVICGVWLLSLTSGVVANDRLNVSDHKDLRELIYVRLNSIDNRLVKIETKLEKWQKEKIVARNVIIPYWREYGRLSIVWEMGAIGLFKPNAKLIQKLKL